jgi:predicted flavoprotein YhiN
MHVCIIGTGASGWMCCNLLKDLEIIEKITIVGSPIIPSIGVGESNTLTFVSEFLNKLLEKKDLLDLKKNFARKYLQKVLLQLFLQTINSPKMRSKYFIFFLS